MPDRAFNAGAHPVDGCALFLSNREAETLTLAAQGLTDTAIGRLLALAPRTVRQYLQQARQKLNAANTTHAVALALSYQLIEIKSGGPARPRCKSPGDRAGIFL